MELIISTIKIVKTVNLNKYEADQHLEKFKYISKIKNEVNKMLKDAL